MSVSCTLNTAPHQQNFTFCMKPLGERRKEFHHGETFGHSFTCVGNCVKPHWDTNRVSPCNYAIKSYNEREVVGPLSLWNCAMKLCIEGDIYFIPKFHILETGTVKLSIETDLISYTVGKCGSQVSLPCAHAERIHGRRTYARARVNTTAGPGFDRSLPHVSPSRVERTARDGRAIRACTIHRQRVVCRISNLAYRQIYTQLNPQTRGRL
jgi:hypothetical protein